MENGIGTLYNPIIKLALSILFIYFPNPFSAL